MDWAIKCTLDELYGKRSVFYTGGTNGDTVGARAAHWQRAYRAFDVKMYYARTSNVKFQEDKLRDKFRPEENDSNCDDSDGFVYVLCSKDATMPSAARNTVKRVKKDSVKSGTVIVKKVAAKDKCEKWGCQKACLRALGKGHSERCTEHKGMHLD